MSRICPKCNAQAETETLICPCGYLFVGNIVASQTTETDQLQRVRKYRVFKKIGILTGAMVLLLSVVAYLNGIIRLDDEDTQEPLAAESLVDPGADSSTKTQPVKSAGKFEIFQVKTVFTGSVITVVDNAQKESRLTLFGLRTPKLNESLGQESKQNLEKLILGKSVYVRLRKTKEIDTSVGEVVIGNANIGLEQLRAGFAWLLPDDLNELTDVELRQYLGAETIAKNGNVGVWSTNDPVPSVVEKVDDASMATVVDPSAKFSGKDPSDPIQPVSPSTDRPRDNPQPVSLVKREPKQLPLPVEPKSSNDPPLRADSGVVENKKPSGAEPMVRLSSGERKFILGPRGGCFYLSPSGNKNYVDRSNCN